MEIEVARMNQVCDFLDRNDLGMGWWRSCKDIIFLEMEHEEGRQSIGIRMEVHIPGVEARVRRRDITNKLLALLKYDVCRAVLRKFLGLIL